MSESVFRHMQAAIDIVGGSTHPKNKIAATLFTENFHVSDVNHWPENLAKAFPQDHRIGNSSGTVHAETACLLKSPQATEGASICITDPFCPNCAKNLAEAGIKTVYIDHKGFEKDFFARRSGHFQTLSMRICEKAGIAVYEVQRTAQKIIPIFEPPPEYVPVNEAAAQWQDTITLDEEAFRKFIEGATQNQTRRRFAAAFAKTPEEKCRAITVRAHPSSGFSMQNPEDAEEVAISHGPNNKYSLIQEPVNRLLMLLARKGLRLHKDYLYCSQVPTAREQVNLCAAGIARITVGDLTKSRDRHGLEAMRQLRDADVMIYG